VGGAGVPTHWPLPQSVCRDVAVVTICWKVPMDAAHNAPNDDLTFPDPCQHQSLPDGARRQRDGKENDQRNAKREMVSRAVQA
jgi:hypothetical protein